MAPFVTELKSGKKISRLNELEMVNGWILVNVWYSTQIMIVSPVDGYVYGYIECKNIIPSSVKGSREAVLNGIAYDLI